MTDTFKKSLDPTTTVPMTTVPMTVTEKVDAKMLELYGPREKWTMTMRFFEGGMRALVRHQLAIEYLQARIDSGEFKKKEPQPLQPSNIENE